MSSGLYAYFVTRESILTGEQVSYMIYGNKTGNVVINVQTKNISTVSKTNYQLRWQNQTGRKMNAKLKSLGTDQGTYLLTGRYRINYRFHD